MDISFFKSREVKWKQGIRLKRAHWHSCEQWGWSSINRGEHLARWCDYFVLSVCWRSFGVCWYFYPKAMR